MSKKIFHFTLGPVQGFVAQARRTRDLWAGSFLLSWLSGKAMENVLVQHKDNKIIFPEVGTLEKPLDPMLAAILQKKVTGLPETPAIGSLPNRFKAEVAANFTPDAVGKAVTDAWLQLSDTVYDQFVGAVVKEQENVSAMTVIPDIWQRQVKNFWEINWVLGNLPEEIKEHEDDRWLDYRKNWRSHWPAPEGGDHCTLMGDFQEISGCIRSWPDQRKQQDDFWKIMQGLEKLGRLEIRDSERLCAIALIKRLFPKLPEKKLEQTIGWVPGGSVKTVGNWPSTTYMAVVPWLRHICEEENRIAELYTYIKEVEKTVGEQWFKVLASEQATELPGLEKLYGSAERRVNGKNLSSIDGDLLHKHALKNHRATYLGPERSEDIQKDSYKEQRGILFKLLTRIHKKVNREPRSYYSLLLMDGDSLGKLLRRCDQGAVSRALLNFTSAVPEIVTTNDGVTIYAGGDDVLALLPLDTAINCAEKLREQYSVSFRRENIADSKTEKILKPTISGAVIYAHHQVALKDVVGAAHTMLEVTAKEENNRSSLALGVLKPSGITAQWVSGWGHADSPVPHLQKLIEKTGGDTQFPRGFFHKLRDRYMLLAEERGGSVLDIDLNIDLKKILVAELMKTVDKTISLPRAEALIDLLIRACSRYKQIDENMSAPDDAMFSCCSELQLDGGYIARFLSQEKD